MEIVSAIRHRLIEKIGQDRFDVWFGSSVDFQFDAGELAVTASSAFIVERIRNLFSADLHEVGSEIAGEVSVAYRVDSKLAKVLAEPSSHLRPKTTREVKASESCEAASATRCRKFASLKSFAVGATNRLAFTAAQSVPHRLGAVTPLVFHGPTGCGKTHLLEGIWSATRIASRRQRIVMLSAEQFTSYFLEALQGSGLPSFRRKYRDVDLLIIDDVQFFSGKRATLMELQHTLDSLLREGRQIVLAADRPPGELQSLGAELVARMSGGLVCGIEQADEETRFATLQQFATSRELAVPEAVLRLIAAELVGDARQLSGALNRLHASSQALQQPISVGLAVTALSDLFQNARRTVQMPDIQKAICDVFGLDERALQSKKKSNAVSHPRMLAMWLARRYTRAAYSEIGEFFGRRSHSTVISAQKKVESWVDEGTQIRLAGGSDCRVADAIKRVELRLRSG